MLRHWIWLLICCDKHQQKNVSRETFLIYNWRISRVMRMRKKKHTGERLTTCADYFFSPNNMFRNVNPIHLEIGCGKGYFICEIAQNIPNVNFIAVEKIPDVIVLAMEKAKSLNLTNVKFIIADAKNLAAYFNLNKISAIYLNFSDPWEKRYQHNHRLTHQSYLDIYKKFLTHNAKIILKTDNVDFFDFSLKTLPLNNFKIINKTYDLYNSEFINGNIQTEYEKKFIEQNIMICRLEAIFSSTL